MPDVDQFISVTDAKNRFLDIIRTLKQRQEVVAITRDGVPAAVLLSMEQFEGLLDTIEILGDPKTLQSVRRSLKQAKQGRWVSDAALFGRARA
ncbi:MAG: type II toxin-antitoxin system Phd/YefM family antitoxin [Betaproteobacteria bacterium]|nr:type II toxin-antitoxin system Phd/YefM family antitoxin [Betaproteobacteria bacterium]